MNTLRANRCTLFTASVDCRGGPNDEKTYRHPLTPIWPHAAHNLVPRRLDSPLGSPPKKGVLFACRFTARSEVAALVAVAKPAIPR
jgi:hypothetical protein